MVNVGDIWCQCDDVKIIGIELNSFCNLNTVVCYFTSEAHDGNSSEALTSPNGCCMYIRY